MLHQADQNRPVRALCNPSKSSKHHAVDSQGQSRGYKRLPDICSIVASCLCLAQIAYTSAGMLLQICAVTANYQSCSDVAGVGKWQADSDLRAVIAADKIPAGCALQTCSTLCGSCLGTMPLQSAKPSKLNQLSSRSAERKTCRNQNAEVNVVCRLVVGQSSKRFHQRKSPATVLELGKPQASPQKSPLQ